MRVIKVLMCLSMCLAKFLFVSWIKTEMSFRADPLIAVISVLQLQQYLSNSLDLKVDVATYIFYTILHCLYSTASCFKGRVKIVCGRKHFI